MITTKDRMGGFISAKIVDVKQIDSFLVSGGNVRLVYKDAYIPTSLDIFKNGVDASASLSSFKSGEIFNVDITIEIKELVFLSFRSFNKYLAILELPTGEQYLFGSPHFPLTITSELIFAKTASGRSGGLIKMKGKQPHNILIMQ